MTVKWSKISQVISCCQNGLCWRQNIDGSGCWRQEMAARCLSDRAQAKAGADLRGCLEHPDVEEVCVSVCVRARERARVCE
jgi:hypothetical protein